MKDILVQVEYSWGYSSETFDFSRRWVVVDPMTMRAKSDRWFSLFGAPDLFHALVYYVLYLLLAFMTVYVGAHATVHTLTPNHVMVIEYAPVILSLAGYIWTKLHYDIQNYTIHFGHGYGEPQKSFYKFLDGELSLYGIEENTESASVV